MTREQLPSDVEGLAALALSLSETLEERDQQLAQLLHRLQVFERAMFGRKSERVAEGQQELPFDPSTIPPQTPPPPPDSEGAPTDEAPPRRKGAHGRRRMPANLPILEEVLDVSEEEKTCKDCGCEKCLIGEEVSDQIDMLRTRVFIRRRRRKKYACRPCEGNVSVAEKPQDPIEKGLPGEGLLAEVIVGKFDDHLPLYRLEEILARHGIEIARSTQCDWLRESAKLLRPIREAMKIDLLRSRVVRFDETVVPVLDLGKTRTAYLAAFLGDVEHPHVVFDYWPNRSKAGPLAFLDKYSGYGQADAYKGYDAVFKDGKIIEVGCNAHARRKAYDARTSDSGNAHIVIAYYRELYAIERDARGRSPDERHRIRQARARPVWDRFRIWLDPVLPSVLPKSPMGEALGYIDRQWCALTRYLDDGILEIDNNDTERVLRSVAIGRKNWLFAGNDKAGARHAIFYTLIETCHRHHVNTWLYIQDVLSRVGTTPVSAIADLFPHRWKETHPDAVLPPLDRRDTLPDAGSDMQFPGPPSPLNGV